MNLRELILKNRSYRRFYEDIKISNEALIEFIDNARFTPSARNAQPLKYFISNDDMTNQKIFSSLVWAGYLKDWGGPKVGERPSAYIIIVLDKKISDKVECDHGIVAQTIMLSAVEKGYGGCILRSFNKEIIQEIIGDAEKFEPLLVLALGKPKENVILVEMEDERNIKYYRDESGNHNVPKRKLSSLILNKEFENIISKK
jgi:nitroreductase